MSTLLLLHGLGLTGRSWAPVRGLLEQHHERVLAPDLAGFGAEPALDGRSPTVGALADVVEAGLDHDGIGRVAVAGNSLGGSVGLELARRGRAERVVVLGPAGMESAPERVAVMGLNETLRGVFTAAAPMATFLTVHPGSRAALLGSLHGRPWKVEPEDAAAEIRAFASAPGFHDTLRHAAGTWGESDLSGVDVPVRICVGSRDLLIGAISAPRYVAAIPGAELVPLPGCGHVPMHDDPDLVARVIVEHTG